MIQSLAEYLHALIGSDFTAALADPDYALFRHSLAMCLLASVAFGMVGSYVVARRISYLAGAISHSILAGIGFALYAAAVWQWTWLTPMLGALGAGVLSALVIGLVSMHASEREDTVIGALWAIGMAVGLLFIHATPSYVDPMSYLFGDILIVSANDLALISILDAVVVLLALAFYRSFLALAFDEEFARLRGVRTRSLYMLLLILTALTIVLMVSLVGIVMVIALLTLPAAIASAFTRKLWQMMVVATGVCMVVTTTGLQLSYSYDTPSGATIISIAGVIYIASVVCLAAARALRHTHR